MKQLVNAAAALIDDATDSPNQGVDVKVSCTDVICLCGVFMRLYANAGDGGYAICTHCGAEYQTKPTVFTLTIAKMPIKAGVK